MSFYEVTKQFITYFTAGATVAPEVIDLIALVGTLALVWAIFVYPFVRIFRR